MSTRPLSDMGAGPAPDRWQQRAIWRWAPPIMVLLAVIPALAPLWQPGLQQTDDGMHHLFRLFNLDLALRAGHPGARWLADEGFGYGFPVLNFYAPLTYYIGLLIRWLGIGFASTLEVTLAAGLLLASLAMYLFGRDLLGPWGGALAAVAYVWAPYHLADAWTRGALAELWAFVWFPLLLLAMRQATRPAQEGAQRNPVITRPVIMGSVSLAGLILTHNLSLLLAAPLMASWATFLLLAEVRGRSARAAVLGGYATMAGLGLLLSAVFWLPAIAESGYVWASRVSVDFAQWAQALAPAPSLISGTWAQPYTFSQGHPLGLAQAVVAGTGLAIGLWRWRALRRAQGARLALPLWVGLTLLALFLQTPGAAAVWRTLPGLQLLQFPWRWQAISALALAMISGYGIFALGAPEKDKVRPSVGGVALLVCAAALLISSALPGLQWSAAAYPTSEEPVTDANVSHRTMALYDYGRGLWLREHGNVWMFEYMPSWAQASRAEFFLGTAPGSRAEPPLDAQVRPGRQTPLERRFTVTATQPWTMQLHQFYFPGWRASVDGQVMPARPSGPLGLAGISLPAGQHEVVFRFGATPVRVVGGALSLVGLGLLLAGVIRLKWRRWLVSAGVVCAIFVLLVAYQRAAHPADITPAATVANFGNDVQLVGYHTMPTLGPGRDNTVLLQWLALRQPTADYKVFVRLVDHEGRLWAQHDGQPGFWFSPTTRWQPGEIVEDRHELEWQGAPPPGRYRLYVGLYDPASGARLPLLDAGGLPAGDQVLMGELDLES